MRHLTMASEGSNGSEAGHDVSKITKYMQSFMQSLEVGKREEE